MKFFLVTFALSVSAQYEGLAKGRSCPTHKDVGEKVWITSCGNICEPDRCVVEKFDDAENPTDIWCGCLPAVGEYKCSAKDTEEYAKTYGLGFATVCAQDDQECDCRVTRATKTTSDGAGQIECGCVEKEKTEPPKPSAEPPASYEPPSSACEYRAYDDNNYCRCASPRQNVQNPALQEVSVCGDATYLLEADASEICSGSGEKPSGTLCPKKGDTTTLACRSEILSYLTGGSTGECKAPEDAVCVKLTTGAWGCVFPGNCNTVNTCTAQPTCNDGYEKNQDGTCKVAENGYPVPDVVNNTSLYDTTPLTELQADSETKDSDGASSVALSLTAIILAATAIYVF